MKSLVVIVIGLVLLQFVIVPVMKNKAEALVVASNTQVCVALNECSKGEVK